MTTTVLQVALFTQLLAKVLHEVRNFIVEKASTSAGQLTINQEMISSLEIPIFSLSEQRDLIQTYKEKITESDSLIKILKSQIAEINRLPASLLRSIFGF